MASKFIRMWRDQFFWLGLSTAINFLTLVVAFVAITITLPSVQTEISGVNVTLQVQNFRIISPTNGQEVDISEHVAGVTPFIGQLRHYLTVGPATSTDRYIQGGEIPISTQGTWVAPAKFGNITVGCGETFIIQALATMALLTEASSTMPADAIFSSPVAVKRLCDGR